MKLVALMPVKNEEWILRLSAEVALRWCDHLVILLHDCTDASASIAQSFAFKHEVTILHREGPWAEMEHRQALLEAGRAADGTHFALIDADEILTASALGDARRQIALLQPGECLDVPMLPVWGDLQHVRSDDCVWTRAWLTLAFCDHQGLHWEAREDGYAHHHRRPYGAKQPALRVRTWTPAAGRAFGGAGVMHLQFADQRRLRAKHALYKVQEVLRWPGREAVSTVDAKYNQALEQSDLRREPTPPGWWKGYDKTLIDMEGIPWQENETKRLRELHGEEAFRGLELWGVGA